MIYYTFNKEILKGCGDQPVYSGVSEGYYGQQAH